MASKYNSFFCPSLLLQTCAHLQSRWPIDKSASKILYLSAVYVLQNLDRYNPKEVYLDEEIDVEKVMIRVEPIMLEGIQMLVEKFQSDKTSIYIYSFSVFLEVLEEIVEELQAITFAHEASDASLPSANNRIIVQEKKLSNMFPDPKDRELLIQDRFRMGSEILCIVDKVQIYKIKVARLFKDTGITPSNAYKDFFKF